MKKEEKIKRLKELERNIETYSEREYNFDIIEKLLKKEIQDEEIGDQKTTYLSSLKNIVKYELFKYKTSIKKRPKKGALSDYNNLTVRFGLVVSMQLNYLKISNE